MCGRCWALLPAAVAALALALWSAAAQPPPPGPGPEPRAARVRRKIVFPKGGKFFVRLNAKDNFIPNSTIFAFAYGYRINFDLPADLRRSPYHRRDLHEDVAELMGRHGLDGPACVRRAACEAALLREPRGLLQRALQLMFADPVRRRRRQVGGRPGSGAEPGACEDAAARCPVSLLLGSASDPP